MTFRPATSHIFGGSQHLSDRIRDWANSRILVDGQPYMSIPDEPRLLVVCRSRNSHPFLVVERVFRYEHGSSINQHFRVNDEEGINQYLREQKEAIEASTGKKCLIFYEYTYLTHISGCLHLRPDIDYANNEEECYQQRYRVFAVRLEEIFQDNPRLIKRALQRYSDENNL